MSREPIAAMIGVVLVDDFLPVYDVSDSVAAVVKADLSRTWEALMDVDLIEVGRRRPMVGLLGALRILPDVVSHALHGEGLPEAPKRLRLRDMSALPPDQGGWVLLGERTDDEIATGAGRQVLAAGHRVRCRCPPRTPSSRSLRPALRRPSTRSRSVQ